MSTEATTKSFQPVECIDAQSADGREIVTIPFSKVKGSLLVISAVDNYAAIAINTTQDNRYWAALMVTITGFVQGYSMILKRQTVAMVSGPLSYYVPENFCFFTALGIRATNVTGGTLGARQDQPGLLPNTAPTAANGFSLMCQVQLTAQGGIGGGF